MCNIVNKLVELKVTEGCRVYSKEYDDIYFNEMDGRAESEHVFFVPNKIDLKLNELVSGERKELVITELGFGTGLNFFHLIDKIESLPQSKALTSEALLEFRSVDLVCLSEEQMRAVFNQLKFEAISETIFNDFIHYWQNLEKGKWGKWRYKLTNNIWLELRFYYGDVNYFLTDLLKLKNLTQVWFLDGFAPSKNGAMWSNTVFEMMERLSQSEASYSTFTVAGEVRRKLKEVGFTTEKIAGYGRKREMLRGEKRHR